uniref:Transposon TX1 uncharacterized n=1 Tax=Tanacetum cinerariifolium TaxID=118510 RepID=A0A699J9A1_TANCI|nr:transposon TX1 uncharacterized [Tanacetum cinerariifolium]
MGLMNRWQGAWCIFGDLNVVRSHDDRVNSQVNIKEMPDFNNFINNTRLIEISMRGRKFTRVSDDGTKFSKLDRFLLNDKFNELWGNLSVIALDRKLSDHCSIVIRDVELDFGPKPFRVFDIRMKDLDFFRVVEEAWRKEIRSARPDCKFRGRLKKVKASLPVWSKDRFGGKKEKVENLRKEAMRWELEAENRVLNDSERTSWLEARKQWEIKEREYGNMLHQKSRIKWDAEGDENLNFFHSFVRRRNNKCNLKGLMVEGVWCEDPKTIKAQMAKHYKNLFSNDGGGGGRGNFWPISLIRCYYKIIAKMLAKRVKQVVGNMVGEVQNTFIKGRYILDGVLIANETIDYLKKNKGKSLIFKVDFEKAYVSITWRFLLDIMKKIGFGYKWCKWVDTCLRTSSVSVLVNGSPSEEFGLERGVRQGDPLSPFLFILATGGLNAIVTEAVEKGIFSGVVVGANNVTVSGLKVNYNKSKIYDIGVNDGDITDMARWMGCGTEEFPFSYLGLPIGENMRRGLNIGSLREKTRLYWVNGGGGGLGGRAGAYGLGRLMGVGIEFTSSFYGTLGDGRDIRFWVDRWVDIRRLCDRFPRLYHLDRSREGSVLDKGSWVNGVWCWKWDWVRDIKGRVSTEFRELVGVVQDIVVHSNDMDKWRWMLGDYGEFTVKELARLVERALKGRLPVSVELDRRGVDLDSGLCPCCNNVVETCGHSLVTCDLAMGVWEKVFNWWKVGNVNAFSIDEIFSSGGGVNVPTLLFCVWQVVIWTSGYFIWKERNSRVFGKKVSSTNKIVQDIQLKRFEWFVRRSKKYKAID